MSEETPLRPKRRKIDPDLPRKVLEYFRQTPEAHRFYSKEVDEIQHHFDVTLLILPIMFCPLYIAHYILFANYRYITVWPFIYCALYIAHHLT